MVGVVADITERKSSEQHIAWLASFPERNPMPVTEVDGSGRLHYTNPAAQRILADLEERGLQHPWLAGLAEIIAARSEGRPPLTGDVRIGRAWYQQTIIPTDEGRYRVYGLDITARREAEGALRESERARAAEARLLDTILTATDSRLAYLDRDLRYVRVNAAYAANARMAPEDFVGRHRLEVFPNAPEVAAMYQRVLDTGAPDAIPEYTGVPLYRPEVGPRCVRIEAVPIKNERGEADGLVTSMMDITDQVQTREKLLEAERARARLAETLVSEIGHRTKNNLAIVAGLLQMQMDREAGRIPGPDLIRDAVTRILSFAALHEQMYQSRTNTIELVNTLRRIGNVNRQALSAGDVVISVEGEPVHYPSDVGTNICVVANELLTNAIKHGGSQDGARQVEVQLSHAAGMLTLSIWDSGNPIPEDFDLGRWGKTGLGLVRTIVEEQYGGSLTLVPHQGGTMAKIVLDDRRVREGR